MKVYNKETYNAESKFYRKKDWGINVPDDFQKDNFTEAVPHGIDQPVIPKQHWDANSNDWQLDEDIDQGTLDAMNLLPKLEVYEALEELPEELTKFNQIMQNESFKMKFLLSDGLRLEHPATVAALALVNIDVLMVKRKIIERKNK